MNKEYIKREAVIRALQKCDELANFYGVRPTLNDFKNAIYNGIPSKDIKSVAHGRWYDEDCFDAHGSPIYRCSVCNKTVADNYISEHKYCLHCGAEMLEGSLK